MSKGFICVFFGTRKRGRMMGRHTVDDAIAIGGLCDERWVRRGIGPIGVEEGEGGRGQSAECNEWQ